MNVIEQTMLIDTRTLLTIAAAIPSWFESRPPRCFIYSSTLCTSVSV